MIGFAFRDKWLGCRVADGLEDKSLEAELVDVGEEEGRKEVHEFSNHRDQLIDCAPVTSPGLITT